MEVLNTHVTFSLEAHSSHWCQLSSGEISTIPTVILKIKITAHASCKDRFASKVCSITSNKCHK